MAELTLQDNIEENDVAAEPTYNQDSAAPTDFFIDTSKAPATSQGFAEAALPIVTSPQFENLPFDQKTSIISKAYNSKKWDEQTYDLVSEAMKNVWDGADPEELPDLSTLIGGPPPVQTGEDPVKVTEAWKKDKTQELLRSGISPALFGGRLDDYLNKSANEEIESFTARNRSIVGEAANLGGNFIRDIAKGAGYGITKPIAGITRLAGFNEAADTVQDLPEYFGKPARDYLYQTDDQGHLLKNEDGTFKTRWASSIGQGIGQVGALIAGGLELRTLGFAQGAISVAVGGVNALTLANDSFKEVYDSTRGDTGKAYKAALFSLPAAAIGSLGELSVISKWANPAVASLSNYNKALYFANTFARNAAITGATTGAMDATQQVGETSQTGKPFNLQRTGSAIIYGGVTGGVLSLTGKPNEVPKSEREPTAGAITTDLSHVEEQLALPGPDQRLGLPAPEERTGLPAPANSDAKQLSSPYVRGPGTESGISAYGSPKDQVDVTAKLEAFQKSEASQRTLTADEAKTIPPEMLPLFQVDLASDGQSALLTKKESYVQRDAETSENIDTLIAGLHKNLSESPTPNNIFTVVDERNLVKRQLAEQSKGVSRSMVEAVKQRKILADKYESIKAQAEAEKDYTLKKVLRLEADDAGAELQNFDDANEGVYNAHEKIGELQDRLDALNKKLKDVSSPTYANDIKAKERNLNNLLRKRKELDLKAAESETQAKQYSSGVNVEGNSVIPVNSKWYVVDPQGNILGHQHTYFGDAVDAIKGSRAEAVQHARPEETGFLMRDNTPDRTALTPEQNKAIEEQVSAQQKEIEKVTNNKAEARKQAEKSREELYKEELAAQKKKAATEDKARKTKSKKEGRTGQVTALAEGELGLSTETEVSDNISNDVLAVAIDARPTAEGAIGLGMFSDSEKAALKEAGYVKEFKKENGETYEGVDQESLLELRDERKNAAKAQPSQTVEKKVIKPGPLSETRRRLSEPKHPLTSNYTKPVTFQETSTKEVKPSDIFKKVQNLASKISKDTKIFEGGRASKGNLGFLNFVKNYANLSRFNDPMTLLHEFKHIVDRALIGKWDATGIGNYKHIPEPVLQAIRDMADMYYPVELRGDNLRTQEGLAMFFQHHATGQPVRKEVLDWYNTSFAKEHPEVYKAMEGIKDLTYDYYNQTPLTHSGSLIDAPPNTKINKIRKYFTAKNLDDAWGDDTAIFTEVDRLTGKKGKIKDWYDTNHGRATDLTDYFVNTGIVDLQGVRNENAMGLMQALSPAKGKEDILGRYLTDKRRYAYYKAGIEPGSNLADIVKTIEEVERSHPDVVLAANNYYRWTENVNDVVASSSRSGKAYIDRLRKDNLDATGTTHGYYLPLQRTGKGSVNSSKTRTGSTRSVIDPLTSIKDNLETRLTQALNSQVKEQLVNLASGPDASSIGLVMREVTGKDRAGLEQEFKETSGKALGEFAKPEDVAAYSFTAEPMHGVTSPDFKTFPIMDGNKLRFFEVDPRVVNAFSREMPPILNNFFFRYLWRPGAQLLRPMATTLRAAFQIKNLLRDPITAWETIQTGEGGFKDALALGNNLVRSMIDTPLYMLGKRKTSWTALMGRLGVVGSTRAGAENRVRLEMQKKYGENFLDLGGATLDKIEKLFSFPEVATRTAATRTVLESMGVKDPNQPLTQEQTLAGILTYKRSTTNFGIQGYDARILNQGVPFFTSTIAGLYRLPQVVRNNPARLAASGAAMLTYGVYHALAHKDEQWYQEMEPEAKMKAVWTTMNFGDSEKMVYFPLQGWTALTYGLGQAIGTKMGSDSEGDPSVAELAKAYINANSPLNISTTLSPFMDLSGPWVKEGIQQFGNYDTFTKRSIVPPNLYFKDPKAQYNEYTTELAKSVADITGISPMRLDHAIRSAAPAIADILQFADKLTGAKTESEYQGMNFVFSALSRSGTTSGAMDRSQRLFTEELIKYRANQIAETPEEANVRKNLERANTNISNINTFIYGIDDQKLKDELRQEKRELLKQGLRIAKGIIPGSGSTLEVVPHSRLAAQAKALRKQKRDTLGEELRQRRENAAAAEKLVGSSEEE